MTNCWSRFLEWCWRISGREDHGEKVSAMQNKLLRYLYSSDQDEKDPAKLIRGYHRYGFISVEHFLQSMPEEKARKYHRPPSELEILTANKVVVGRRFVLKVDAYRRGKCVRIFRGDDLEEDWVEIQLDQPINGTVVPSIKLSYPLSSLTWEKEYLKCILNDADAPMPHILKRGTGEGKDKDTRKRTQERRDSREKRKTPQILSPLAKLERLRTDIPKTQKSSSISCNTIGIPNDSNENKYGENSAGEEESESKDASTLAQLSPRNVEHGLVINPVSTLYNMGGESTGKGSTKKKGTSLHAREEEGPVVKKSKDEQSEKDKVPIKSPVTPILFGKKRGIQGANNSCYADATLFALLYATEAFDQSLLEEKERDSENAKALRHLLRNDVVEPLRCTTRYCPAKKIMKLRNFLALATSDSRYSGAMMDAEELIYSLFQDVCNEKPFLHYHNNEEDFIHQIIVDGESTNGNQVTTIQSCLEDSFRIWGDLKLASLPYPAFLVQVPRTDGVLQKYSQVFPNFTLDLDPISLKKTCSSLSCEATAEWEDCARNTTIGFCSRCLEKGKALRNESYFHSLKKMELFAVVCIRSAHYTSFVKRDDKDWLYFDSMAGRFSDVVLIKDFKTLRMQDSSSNLDEVVDWQRRLAEDCHICIYLPLQR